jgi:uncharacterized protein
MEIHVARLLQSEVGERRSLDVDEDLDGIEEASTRVRGTFDLVRTNDGILVRGLAMLTVHDECARCLEPASEHLRLRIAEEFFPTVDVSTGTALPPPREEEAFTIDSDHVLRMQAAVREYASAARPLALLCRPDCKGLCPTCGANLNTEACGHEQAAADPRWAALRSLVVQEE